jgi:hypothetical protein
VSRRPLFIVAFVLASCGSAQTPSAQSTDAVVATATASPTPTPSPTVEPASNYFRSVTGYEWVQPPPALQDAVEKAFADPALAQYFSGAPQARLVTQRGDPTPFVLLVLPLQASYAALPTTMDSIIQGYGGAPPKTVTIAGRRAVLVVEDARYAFKSLVWQQRTFVLWLYGFSGVAGDAMTSFAESVITANQ